MEFLPLLILVPTLLFAFMNGANDSGTMAASVVSSRCLSPRAAVLWAAIASFLGALLLGSAVARMLGQGLIHLDRLPVAANPFGACVAAVAAAICWGGFAWYCGLPGSYTHALLGGWFGGFMGIGGPSVVNWGNAGLVLAVVLLTPLLGLVVSWAAIRVVYRLGSELSMQTRWIFRGVEKMTFLALSLVHGANAAQKSMALLVLAGISLGAGHPWPTDFVLPFWVRCVCSAAFALGVLLGFTRTLRVVGFGIFKVETLHSFTALGVSGLLILISTMAGLPLSAGQINSSALLGTGAGDRAKAVRWDVAFDFVTNWVLTFPAAAVLAYVLVKVAG